MKKVIFSIITTCALLTSVCTTGNAEINNKGETVTTNSVTESIPVPVLPKTSGSYQVGTTNFDWVDTSRKDLLTPDPNDNRELMVQFWYPIDSGKGKVIEKYIPSTEKGIGQMITSKGFEKKFSDINKINTQSYKDGILSNKKAKYPIVLFSHGNMQSRWNYQTITRELASHGFIVVSIEHSHYALGTEFTNGKFIPNDYQPNFFDHKKDDADMNQLWVKDIQFVISKLGQLNLHEKTPNFKNRLDLNKISAIGHSLGGAAAARALQVEPKIKSAIDIDGSLVGLSGKTGKMTKPFAFIKTEDHAKQLNGEIPQAVPENFRKQVEELFKLFSTRYQQAVSGPAYDITIAGATHMNFSDSPLLQQYLSTPDYVVPHLAETKITDINKLTNMVILSFLEKTLNGKKNTILDVENLQIPDLTIVQ
ncbi:alpha/beta hydrolase family protein [Bacillus sp. CGMCC 1.16607]|uniref:alpha/beta hydrolase family protein n=1 Tax=Bacillus sp. CGMCC 1.16607 TaxID=3351842 RepID=UPI00363FD63D